MRRPIITVKREWTNPIIQSGYGLLASWHSSRDIEVTPYSDTDVKIFNPPREDGVIRTAKVILSSEKKFRLVLCKYRVNLPVPNKVADFLEKVIW